MNVGSFPSMSFLFRLSSTTSVHAMGMVDYITPYVDQIILFKWTTEVESRKTASLEEISNIKNVVGPKLVDDCLTKLKEQKLILKMVDPVLDRTRRRDKGNLS